MPFRPPPSGRTRCLGRSRPTVAQPSTNLFLLQQVLQQLRADLALRYLADERLSVTEIGFLLGYSDQGSFSAAFKSWHGMSPLEHRQR